MRVIEEEWGGIEEGFGVLRKVGCVWRKVEGVLRKVACVVRKPCGVRGVSVGHTYLFSFEKIINTSVYGGGANYCVANEGRVRLCRCITATNRSLPDCGFRRQI